MKHMKRRYFLKKSTAFSLGLSLAGLSGVTSAGSRKIRNNTMKKNNVDARTYLNSILYTKKEIEDWLAGEAFPFSKYNSELGWLLPNARFRDGFDDSVSVYTYADNQGERLMSNYKTIPCRINTYGDSFTQCHQVSDHETWQEILAAHLQEPVRNYGIGGWSVYQAYLRMLKEEKRHPSDYIIFNIYEDDHKRNLDAWRNIRVHKHPQHIEAPLPYLKVNLAKNQVIPCKNPCPTEYSLYDLCDIDKAYQLFKDDFVLNIMVAHQNAEEKNTSKSYQALSDLIKTHGITTEIDESRTISEEAERIHLTAAFFSSQYLMDKIIEFASKENKKMLFVLSYSGNSVAGYIEKGVRFDGPFIDYLERKNLTYIDLLKVHAGDYKKYKSDLKTYISRYFIGHYNPLGNHFCSFSLKNTLVDMLDPKPMAYRSL